MACACEQPGALRPLLDLLGARPGDVLQLRYQGRQGSVVQVAASLVSHIAASPGAASLHGDTVSQAEQLGAAEAAAELLGLRMSETELPSVTQLSGQQGAAPSAAGVQAAAAETASGEQGTDGDGGESGHMGPEPAAKRRMLERGSSGAGLQPPRPEPGPLPAEQQHAKAADSLQAGEGGAGDQQVPTGQPTMQPAPPPPAPSVSKGSGGSTSADAAQQAAAKLAAALEADDQRRPSEQMRAVLHTLGLMGVEPGLSAVGCSAGRGSGWTGMERQGLLRPAHQRAPAQAEQSLECTQQPGHVRTL